jgi:hypothetical protein
MGGIYEVCRWDGLSRHDVHTKFHKDWFSHSEVNGGGYTVSKVISWADFIFFFQNKER